MEFKDILKDILTEFGYNQTQFANLIGVKPSQVSEWLSGKANPGYDTLKAMATALHVSSDYLLGIEDVGGAKLY